MIKKKQIIVVAKTNNVSIGDSVTIQTKTSDFLKAGFLLFILPVIGLFAGIAVTGLFAGIAVTGLFLNPHSDWVYFMGGLIGLIIAFAGLKILSRHISVKGTIIKE